MVFYLVGLGLGDAKDITVRGLEIVKKCKTVYLEAYTSVLCFGLEKEKLEEFYGRPIEIATRETVEQGSDEILRDALKEDICLLVVGDPFGATTHSDLVLRAKQLGVTVRVCHNASIMNAIGCCGLQLYRFGEAVSLCFWENSGHEKTGWQPDSYFDRLARNRSAGLHTLCLLDIKVRERTVENIVRNREMYEPPRYMTCAEAAAQLLTISERRRKQGEAFVLDGATQCVGLARVGWEDQRIVAGTLEQLSQMDLGPPLHTLIVCGELHPVESEMLATFPVTKSLLDLEKKIATGCS